MEQNSVFITDPDVSRVVLMTNTQQTASISVAWCFGLVPVQLRLVLVVKAQQQRVKGKTFDPPAGLDGPILHVLGELQNLQPDFSVITQAEEAPEGEGQLVEQTSSARTQVEK